jgi:hypothetical protein
MVRLAPGTEILRSFCPPLLVRQTIGVFELVQSTLIGASVALLSASKFWAL